MSKLSFRARALDATKPMPIYRAEELPDLPDFSAINRAVPQMPSGMQKEEECEHHLQRAICAGLIIPTPEVTEVPVKEFYDKVVPSNYKQPRQLIHMQPFTMEQDIPDYDMDSDDERWLQSQSPKLDLSPLKFEEMMDRLEKSSGQTVVTLNEAKALLKEDDDLIIAVYDYWLNKRLKTQHPLILTVRTEQRIGIAANNPYLAFRRRTEKMQTRKNRKNDEVSYEKMLKLRRDLYRAVTLLELVKRREKHKREYVNLTVEVLEKRYQAQDYEGAVETEAAASKAASQSLRPAFTPIFHNHYPNQSWASLSAAQSSQVGNKSTLKDELLPRREKRQYKKRKHKSGMGGSSRGALADGFGLSSDEDEAGPTSSTRPESPQVPEEVEDEGPYAFRRNKLCSYHMPLPTQGNWPWASKEEGGEGDPKYRFSLTSLSHPQRQCIGFARRRVGRGGRIVIDRVATDYDDFWRGMDFTIMDSKTEETSTTPVATKEEPLSSLDSGLGDMSQKSGTTDKQPDSWSGFDSDFGSFASSSRPSTSRVGRTLSQSNIKLECKVEPFEDEGLKRLEDPLRGRLKEEATSVSNPPADADEMVKTLRSLRRDWLHFRPKTPPSDWEPPCYMLPADEPPWMTEPVPPFTMEVQPLDSESSLFLDSSPFVTDMFELDRRWTTTGNSQVPTTPPEDELAPSTSAGGISFGGSGGKSGGDGGGSSSSGAGVSKFNITDIGASTEPSAQSSTQPTSNSNKTRSSSSSSSSASSSSRRNSGTNSITNASQFLTLSSPLSAVLQSATQHQVQQSSLGQQITLTNSPSTSTLISSSPSTSHHLSLLGSQGSPSRLVPLKATIIQSPPAKRPRLEKRPPDNRRAPLGGVASAANVGNPTVVALTTEVGSTNGLLSQVGLAATAPSSNPQRVNIKLPNYAYTNSAGRLATSAQTITLNSHSANNILELPLEMNTDAHQGSGATPVNAGGVNHTSTQAPTKNNGGGSANAQGTKPALVRNNKNSLVMEVT